MSSKITIEKFNEAFLHISAEGRHIYQVIDNEMSVYKTGYQMTPSYKYHVWDGKLRFFKKAYGLLPIGLRDKLLEVARDYKWEVEDRSISQVSSVTAEDLERWLQKIHLTLTPRKYQLEAVLSAINSRIGILECCTGSGKSLMLYILTRYILDSIPNSKILIIVPNIMLVSQTFEKFVEYGWNDCTGICDMMDSNHKPDLNCPVLISTWQSLKNVEQELFKEKSCVLVDECHSCRGDVLRKILQSCENAYFRIGTTGTLPEEPDGRWMIESVLGTSLYKIRSKTLIEEGYLSDIAIAQVQISYGPDLKFSGLSFRSIKSIKRAYNREIELIENLPQRQAIFWEIFKKYLPSEANILILCNHIEHMKKTEDFLQSIGIEVSEICGKVNAARRESLRMAMENNRGEWIIATYGTMSTGVDIHNVHHIVLWADSKSKIRVLQSLGRGLRKHPSKKRVIIWDIVDDFTPAIGVKNYCLSHWDSRLGYYKDEGFVIKRLNLKI